LRTGFFEVAFEPLLVLFELIDFWERVEGILLIVKWVKCARMGERLVDKVKRIQETHKADKYILYYTPLSHIE
jgi:hypothetical protein